MAPDRHVVRVRKKLPGHHNRRFKGKNTEIDRQRQRREEKAARFNLLPTSINDRLKELQQQVPGHILIDALEVLLLELQPVEVPQMWFFDECLYMVFRGIYVEIQVDGDGIVADCFTDFDDILRTFDQPVPVVKWLLSAFKTRSSR